jgi:hypothetical protein
MIVCIATCGLIMVAIIAGHLHGGIKRGNGDHVCHQLAVRHEWRTLSSSERLEYLRAVKCLSSIPSTVCNGTLHDEFAYIHRDIGDYCKFRVP